MKLLDCFCGLGGVSDGFALEGFEVLGIDVEDMPTKGYKHGFIQADIRELKGEDYQGYDVVWGSPPCRNFSCVGDVFGHTWKKPPDPEGEGMEIVNAYLKFVEDAQPKIWIMENVPRLQKYYKKAKVKTTLGCGTMKRCFWGNFPPFLIPKDAQKYVYRHFYPSKSGKRRKDEGPIFTIQGKDRKWFRAKIPLACSRAFARACREELEK